MNPPLSSFQVQILSDRMLDIESQLLKAVQSGNMNGGDAKVNFGCERDVDDTPPWMKTKLSHLEDKIALVLNALGNQKKLDLPSEELIDFKPTNVQEVENQGAIEEVSRLKHLEKQMEQITDYMMRKLNEPVTIVDTDIEIEHETMDKSRLETQQKSALQEVSANKENLFKSHKTSKKIV